MSSYATPNPSGLNLKRLPPWAWALAIAGGAVVGFVLLKPGRGEPGEAEEGETGADAGAGAKKGEGAVVVEPLTEDMLGALGLTPGFQAQGYTDGVGGTFSGDGSSGDGVGGIESTLFAPSPDAAYGQSYATAQQQVTQQITSVSSPALGAALASPQLAPAPSGGGGSRTVIAQ